jgi:catechol 2,3-dioxygenase-like lactoylglutathione lyase family enzyme
MKAMEPRLNTITLGVADLEQAKSFYRDGLRWPVSSASVGDFVIFRLATGTALALHPRSLLAQDAQVSDSGSFGCITQAQYLGSPRKGDKGLAEAVVAFL